MSFFCPRIPSKIPLSISHHISLEVSWLWQILRLFPLFGDPHSFKEDGQVFWLYLSQNLSDVLLRIMLGVGFGEAGHRSEAAFSLRPVRVHAVNMTPHSGRDLGHLAEVLSVWFLHCKVIYPPLLYCTLWKAVIIHHLYFFKQLYWVIIHIPHNSSISHLKCTIQWFLVHSKISATITTDNFRTFSSPQKETPNLLAAPCPQ